MAIWRQGGFFQDLAEREQHLQWYPKAYVPVTKVGDENVVSITCCTCGTCVCCMYKKAKCKEEEKVVEKVEVKVVEKKECNCDKGAHHHHHHCHCCSCC